MLEELFNCITCRRQFLTKIVSACAVTCAGFGSAFALTPVSKKLLFEQEKHKFDAAFSGTLTNRQLVGLKFGDFLSFAKKVEKLSGRKKTIDIIKEYITESSLKAGKARADSSPDNSMASLASVFKHPRANEVLTMEIVEDTDEAFEIKVTECLFEQFFRQENATHIGFAAVCWGDYALAEGFNSKIKLIRDKTLMEDHGYCNHRYIMTAQ